MKTKLKFLAMGLLVILIYSCRKDNLDKTDFKVVDSIPTNRYYSSDIMPDNNKEIYGNWKAIGTSGGIAGGGFKVDFGYLILKANGIFGVIRNDSLIAFGKMVLSHEEGSLLCSFDFDKPARIQLYYDPEKYLQLIHHDTLNLIAPCCDRYNIQFIRKK
jgi:hypothetical protein